MKHATPHMSAAPIQLHKLLCVMVLFAIGCAQPQISSLSLKGRQACDDGHCDNSATPDSSSAAPDMSPADFSTPPPAPDLGPACVPTGGDCTYHNNSACCSSYCIYSSNTCR